MGARERTNCVFIYRSLIGPPKFGQQSMFCDAG